MSLTTKFTTTTTDQCPTCGTTKQQYPAFQLKYSTCCGRALCTSCVDKLPDKSNRADAVCPSCKQTCTRRDFTSETIESQYYNREGAVRKKLQKTFILQLEDYVQLYSSDKSLDKAAVQSKATTAYNDYTEVVQDLVYDTLYGSKQEIEQVEQKVQQWKAQNGQLLEIANKRLAVVAKKEQQQVTAKNAAEVQATNDTTLAATAPKSTIPTSFTLPTATGQRGLWLSKDEERIEYEKIKMIDDATERQTKMQQYEQERQSRIEHARLAGGWRVDVDRRRNVDEAMQSLFDLAV